MPKPNARPAVAKNLDISAPQQTSGTVSDSPLSLTRLREAFAAMLGDGRQESGAESVAHASNERRPAEHSHEALQAALPDDSPQECEISPRSVVEAVLFVGRPDNAPFTARELAAAMRGVSPAEIESAIVELNDAYDVRGAAYCVVGSAGGYRLTLRPEHERMRDKFYGRIREARLSPAALEVLALLAYNQPSTIQRLTELRGASVGAALSTLVRRRLVQLQRDQSAEPTYTTTDRFLALFGLASLNELPRSEELERV